VTVHAEGSHGTPERLVYSVEEAADLLGIGRTFMFHLVATGQIDSFKIGNRRKIHRDAIAHYLDGLRSEHPSTEPHRRSGNVAP
jgi:excisionase family DNA binding protein